MKNQMPQSPAQISQRVRDAYKAYMEVELHYSVTTDAGIQKDKKCAELESINYYHFVKICQSEGYPYQVIHSKRFHDMVGWDYLKSNSLKRQRVLSATA